VTGSTAPGRETGRTSACQPLPVQPLPVRTAGSRRWLRIPGRGTPGAETSRPGTIDAGAAAAAAGRGDRRHRHGRGRRAGCHRGHRGAGTRAADQRPGALRGVPRPAPGLRLPLVLGRVRGRDHRADRRPRCAERSHHRACLGHARWRGWRPGAEQSLLLADFDAGHAAGEEPGGGQRRPRRQRAQHRDQAQAVRQRPQRAPEGHQGQRDEPEPEAGADRPPSSRTARSAAASPCCRTTRLVRPQHHRPDHEPEQAHDRRRRDRGQEHPRPRQPGRMVLATASSATVRRWRCWPPSARSPCAGLRGSSAAIFFLPSGNLPLMVADSLHSLPGIRAPIHAQCKIFFRERTERGAGAARHRELSRPPPAGCGLGSPAAPAAAQFRGGAAGHCAALSRTTQRDRAGGAGHG
jgi:hypothetical protein